MNGAPAQPFAEALRAWNTDQFAARLKQAIEALPAGSLPLGKTGPGGGAVDDSAVVATVRDCTESGGEIHADVGVFYSEVIAGCSCGEDPMPLTAHARVRVRLERASGRACFELLDFD